MISPNRGYRLGWCVLVTTIVVTDRGLAQESVCARVRLEIGQQAVITRTAFRATLVLNNDTVDKSLEGVGVVIDIRDVNGVPANGLFGLREPELVGIDNIDGAGLVPPESSASASWLIIPSHDAAPTEATFYDVGGELFYTQGGVQLSVPLFPTRITVLPDPILEVKYFLQRDVFSDDPFTPEIEPIEPFSLGLMMSNHGAGAARNVRVTSSQPKIIENERGLLIDFKTIGTQVGTQNVSPSLTVNFGDIDPNKTAIARFLMTSTLQGRFIEYNASFEHVDGLGDRRFSLIDSVAIFELIHVVRADEPTDDSLPDFMTNQVTYPNDPFENPSAGLIDLPDTLHLSNGLTDTVTPVLNAAVQASGDPNLREAVVTTAMPGDWAYIRIADPYGGAYPLVSVTRGDGKNLIMDFNAWQTDRTFRKGDEQPIREHNIHLFDRGGPGVYTLSFQPGETDSDGDGVPDGNDNCPNAVNSDQVDSDGDGRGNACDNCDLVPNPGQEDSDGDGIGDLCDNCPTIFNFDQIDSNQNGVGDACEEEPVLDADRDGVPDGADNCPNASNADQADGDSDGVGDACDNCPTISNHDQSDRDADGVGDACDECPEDPTKTVPGQCGCGVPDADADFDGVADCVDNCVAVANPTQLDTDSDGVGDACDNCPNHPNASQMDSDGDGIGDACAPPPPPSCDAGGPYVAECAGLTTTIALDGSASTDPDPNDTLSFAWTTDCTGASFDDPTSATPILSLPASCPALPNCEVSLTVTDTAGASDFCSASITILDATRPEIACPTDVSVECDGAGNLLGLEAFLGNVASSDTCGAVGLMDDFFYVSDGCGTTGSALVTWTATDDCNLSSVCSATFAIVDTTPPLIGCPPNVTVECDGTGNLAELEAFLANVTASDTCSTVEVSDDFSTLSDGCGISGSAPVTFTATDECGNASPCMATFTIVDTMPPTMTLDTTPITVVDADCSGTEAVVLPSAMATDTCAAATVTHDAPATFPAGETTTVTFTATDACGNSGQQTVDVKVMYGANIAITAERHTVGSGSNPGSVKEPLVGIVVCGYDASPNSCARVVCGGISHRQYECIAIGDGTPGSPCDATSCCTTDALGQCTLNLPPGDYVVISADATKTVLPDPLGVSAGDLECGERQHKYLQQIVKVDGKKVPGKTTRLTGSELLIIEPEYVVWDDPEQLYPFVFESIGDWGVSATVTPPNGFVSDYKELSAEVDNEVEAVQFTITEVGSDFVPTVTVFTAEHGGSQRRVNSAVDIFLTSEYARSRGHDVRVLQAHGLIKDPPKKPKGPKPPHIRR